MSDADLGTADLFPHRHIGPRERDIEQMLATLGYKTLDELIDDTIPASIRLKKPLNLGPPLSEHEALVELRRLADQNRVCRSMIGMGYYDTITPAVIRRNILENPGWYTQYTPYQPEISQGRLEMLLNFQTMVADLTGLPIANASLLDEATAAAEAMHMCFAVKKDDEGRNVFFVADDCHPQTIAVVQTRARPLGIDVRVGPAHEWFAESESTGGPSALGRSSLHESSAGGGRAARDAARCIGVLLQYPNTYGEIVDYTAIVNAAHAAGALVVVATDLLALTLIKPPGEFGADIAIGNSQRFGVPLGFGGPHAAFMACKDEYKRQLPGRLVGVSKDAAGRPAYRLALATREQHIRREKATSNICTAQVLLAVIAAAYAVYHGPGGLKRIAQRVHALTALLHRGLERSAEVSTESFFDTLRVRPRELAAAEVIERARSQGINLRDFGDGTIGISLDETSTMEDVRRLWALFGGESRLQHECDAVECMANCGYPGGVARSTPFLTHPVFHNYHSEHEMLRYLKRLESRDLSLTTSMIPLGSCTMKLNAAAEMLPVTWPEFGGLHPFAPAEQWKGYAELFRQLESWLAEITGFTAISLQPNAGSQGEYSGLLAIRGYHESRGESHRNVCLIPVSAHGTNPASAVMAGMKVVAVACDAKGNIDVADLRAKAEANAKNLAALMVTYPSTHGVFEEAIREICDVVHQFGGQVYMDGANMNAQVGLCRPADIGADVCHLNLHKTFCIPHGGGGPGMGPIGVARHLAAFLPSHPLDASHGPQPPPAASSVETPSAGSSGPQPPPAASRRTAEAYRRRLPHISPGHRPVFVTFSTADDWVLPEEIRARVLEHCLHDHGTKIQMHVAVVMPDHVHLIFSTRADAQGEPYSISEIMQGIKGASAHTINKLLGRKGRVWLPESFDRIIRHDESLQEKIEYVCQNPVRRGLVSTPEAYPWLWREWSDEPMQRSESRSVARLHEDAARSRQPGAAAVQTNPNPGQPGAAAVQVQDGIGPVSAAPYGSPSILPISWMYIRMMGEAGLKRATQVAILNANYMARRLEKHYPVLYTGRSGRVAHEFILDCRPLEATSGVKVEDIAKRLMDYGFHAPTMSFPVAGTLMIEPTESESREELDRLCDALIAIREEIRKVERGEWPQDDNPLKNAPHTARMIASSEWPHPYPREVAAFPAAWVREHKYWPPVARVDNVYGDRNLFCTCVPMAGSA